MGYIINTYRGYIELREKNRRRTSHIFMKRSRR
jgi:hypothetical protein